MDISPYLILAPQQSSDYHFKVNKTNKIGTEIKAPSSINHTNPTLRTSSNCFLLEFICLAYLLPFFYPEVISMLDGKMHTFMDQKAGNCFSVQYAGLCLFIRQLGILILRIISEHCLLILVIVFLLYRFYPPLWIYQAWIIYFLCFLVIVNLFRLKFSFQ